MYYYEKAFARHREDLEAVERGEKPHLRFNKKLGLAYIAVIEQLQHYKGELAGQNIKLEEWQKKLTAILFGWQRLNDRGEWVRRFNTAFIFIPRKNGKTILGSAYSIADSIILGEPGGEVVFFATKRKQASLAWEGARKMMTMHDELKRYTRVAYSTIRLSKNDITFDTLGRDSDTEDGLNVSFGLADEYHAHPDNSLWDVVESSMGSRRQPLMMAITTAGFNVESPAYGMYEYAKKVIDGAIEDDTFFAFIAEPGEGDDPFDEETWRKANPNYGVSVSRDYMQRKAETAKNRPEARNNFFVKNLNIWTSQAESFIRFEDWKRCADRSVDTTGWRRVVGLDLSIADDFSSRIDLFERDGRFHCRSAFYIPESGIIERERDLRVPLYTWVRDGHVTATPGVSIDEERIIADLLERLEDTEALCFDPYRAKIIVSRLENEHGYDSCIPIRQGFLTLSAPTAYLRDLIREGRLTHDDNPAMNWMISNMTVLRDQAGNIKLDKSKPRRKIDGPAALVNALAYMVLEKGQPKKSIYEERGVRAL